MALTDEQTSKALYYLGVPDVNRSLNPAVTGALEALTSEGEARVTSLLTSLESIDTKLGESWDRQKVIRAEEVTLAGPGEIRALRAEGRRLANRLASVLGVTITRDVFGGGSSSGVALRG